MDPPNTEKPVGFEVRKNEVVGRFAIAANDLKAGDLILSEVPFAYGPKTDSAPLCLGCFAYVSSDTLCSKCGWPVCNSTCENIPAHRDYECPVFAKARAKFYKVSNPYAPCLQYECITPLRMLLASEKNPDTWNNDIKCLQTHEEDRKTLEIWNFNHVNIVKYLRGPVKVDRFSEEMIHQVCGILDVNAFEARSLSGNMIRCLYPKSSILSHNCVSNVIHSIFVNGDGNSSDYKITLRASVPISKGEELFISYTYSMWPTITRRAFIKESKYFECNCTRCSDPSELETHMGTLKCSMCDDGMILSTAPLDSEASWKCTYCENTIKSSVVKKMYKTIQDDIDKVDAMRQDTSALEATEFLLEKYRAILHPRNAFLTSLRISLVQMYEKIKEDTMDTQEKKIEHCQQILRNVNILEPGYTRLRGMILYELYAGIISLAVNMYNNGAIEKNALRSKLQEASMLLEEASIILMLEPENSMEGAIGRIAAKDYNQLSENLDKFMTTILL